MDYKSTKMNYQLRQLWANRFFAFSLAVIIVGNTMRMMVIVLPYTLSLPLITLFILWVGYVVYDS